ncbi:hypothetical protein Droror1_Dr00023956 [Drosera rotundifolia]
MSTAAVLLPHHHLSSTVGSTPRRSNRRWRQSPTTSPVMVSKKKQHLVMEDITILKRGESLSNIIINKKNESTMMKPKEKTMMTKAEALDLDFGVGDVKSQMRSKAKTVMMMKAEGLDLDFGVVDDVKRKVRSREMYAGPAAFVNSPPPCCLPFPSNLVRNGVATTDLRRILRI